MENKPAGLLVPLGKTLSGMPHGCGRQPTGGWQLLRELVIALLSLSRDWRMNTK